MRKLLIAGIAGLWLGGTALADATPPAASQNEPSTVGIELDEADYATQATPVANTRGPGTSLILMVTPANDPTIDSTWTLSGSATAVVAAGNTPRFNVGTGVNMLDIDAWLNGGDMTSGSAANDNEAQITSGSATMTIPSAGTFDIVVAYLDVDAAAEEDDIGVALDSASTVPFVDGDEISWTGSFVTEIPFQDYRAGTYNFSVFGNGTSTATLNLTVMVAEAPGACCIDAASCLDAQLVNDCVDAGGVWQGPDSLCVDAQAAGLCVDAPPCPPGALIDSDGVACGQPAPDNINAGCASPSGAFQFLPGDGCASAVCGESSADDRNGGNRDTDWYFFTPIESTEYTACVTAQFFPQVQFWPLNPGIDPCLGVVPGVGATGAPGEVVCATACLLGGNPAAIRITTVDADGNPQRFGVGCTDYVLEVSCDACVVGACCQSDNMCMTDVAEIECLDGGGEYQGDGSDCTGVVCGGACCNQDGTCSDGVSRENCINAGGGYNGQGSLCADVEPCPECGFEDPNNLDGLEGPNEDCTILGVDVVNSGCVVDGPGNLFSTLNCNETICGITAYDGGTRDLDYYHFTLAEETEVLFEIENQMAEGNPLQFRVRWRDPNDPASPFCSSNFYTIFTFTDGDALPPGSSFWSLVLAPARYNVGVFYDFNNDTALPPDCPNGGRYRLTATCMDACTFTCTDTEGEPDCGDVNEINDGCTADPVGPFSAMSLNSKVCGSTRLITNLDGMGLPDTTTRDVDWWLIDIPSDGDYDVNFQAEFEALFLMRRVGDIGGAVDCSTPLIASLQIFQCADVTFTLEGLTAGQYAIFVSADFGSYARFNEGIQAGEACGAPYSLEVVGDDTGCSDLCADANCDGAVTVSDIGFFVTAVANGEAAWNASFPGGTAPCDFCVNDTNGDGFVTVSDIGPFVTAVTSGGCQ